VLSDGPYGLRHQSGRSDNLALFESDPATCFLPGVAVGSSWDTSVAARVGAALGKEAVAQGVDIVLGPGINIKRTPLCGRNFEYYSEDPHLSGVLGVAFTRALQAEGPGVSVKHFAANNQETDRQTISADVDERALREIYFPAFERVVTEARPATVMSSYNKINGVPASEDPWLLTKVLREEWGFEGVVVSDWSAVNDRVAALKAGLDLEMPGGDAERDEEVAAAIASGRITESEIDVSVDRLRALSDRIRRTPVSVGVDLDAHHLLARELAQECVVLLRNQDDTLPIGDGITMAVIGAIAETPRYQGGGSAHVTATRVDLPLEQIRDVAAECAVVVSYAPGYRIDGTHDEELIVEAVSTASQAELAVVFAGLSETRESEGFDRRNLELPPEQVELIRRVAAASQRTVVVLSNGGVVSLEGWHDDVDAIVEGFLLGQGGGRALANILFGRANPSGHLAESIPLRLQDHPSWMNFPGEHGHVRYGEGILVGYRYFATAEAPVRYPFGHGLSYTTFATGTVDVQLTGPDTATVRVDVTNTGDRAGKHVVQVYVATDAGAVLRPARELRGFAKLSLQPGASGIAEIDLSRRAFAHWDTTVGEWRVAGGEYRIEVCSDAHTVVTSSTIALDGDANEVELTLDTPVGAWFDHSLVGAEARATLGLGDVELTPEQMELVSAMTMRQFVKVAGLRVSSDVLEDLAAQTRRC